MEIRPNPRFQKSSGYRNGAGEGYKELMLIMEDSQGEEYLYPMHQFLDYLIIPLGVLVVIQGLDLIGGLFGTGKIRRKLKPLNDLAVKAEKLSSLPLDTSKFESLEQAIENLSPNSPDAKISTGDKDLASIEVALNNLIYRMRESQKSRHDLYPMLLMNFVLPLPLFRAM